MTEYYFIVMSYVITVLATLKITDQIDWSWWLIVSPVAGPLLAMGASIAGLVIGISIVEQYTKLKSRL